MNLTTVPSARRRLAWVVGTVIPLALLAPAAPAVAEGVCGDGELVLANRRITICQQTFTASGTWRVPEGVSVVDAVVVGGGGGGSGGKRAVGYLNEWVVGNGGGGGAVVRGLSVPVSGTVEVTVGAGGSGGRSTRISAEQPTAGRDGDPSSFGPVTADGGGGGEANTMLTGRTAALGLGGSSPGFGPGGYPLLASASFMDPTVYGAGGMGAGGPSAGVAGGDSYSSRTLNAIRRNMYAWDQGSGGNGLRPTWGLFSAEPPPTFGGGGAGGTVGSGYVSSPGSGGGGLSWSSTNPNGVPNTGGGGGGSSMIEVSRVYSPLEAGNGGTGIVIVRWVVPPQITTTQLPDVSVGNPYSLVLQATGSEPFTWSLVGGELPTGISLSPDGRLSGTADTDESSVRSLTFQVRDGQGNVATAAFDLRVIAPLEISTTALPSAPLGIAYRSIAVAVGGVDGLTWEASGLPAGLSMSPAGVITGTPTETGVFEVEVTVTDGLDRRTTKVFAIGASDVAPVEVTAVAPLGTEGEQYEATFSATGGVGPFSWQVTGGALPPGLTLTPSGVLQGTPTQAGTYGFTVTVTDAAGATASAEVDLGIEPGAIEAGSVPICHRTDDGYELVVTTSGVFSGKGEHGSHDGDIVPDLLGVGGARNWSGDNIAVYLNGCASPLEEEVDTDGDGLADAVDSDDDGDGLADVVDEDMDGDGTPNANDADAAFTPDQDGDGLPDALDPDDDGDCLLDAGDGDRDGDGIADAVDGDLDNDGVPNREDSDIDGDGVPNLLDIDADGNGASSLADAAGAGSGDREGRARAAAAIGGLCASDRDPDGDGIPSVSDPDADGDGIPDTRDRLFSRPWVDTDSDGVPDVKDADVDNDGVPNAEDTDVDGDGVPDVRDRDANGDGVAETLKQPLAQGFRIPAIGLGRAVQVLKQPASTVAGQRAAVTVKCTRAESRTRPQGDVPGPGGNRDCFTVKTGGGLRLVVPSSGPLRVTVRFTAPAVDQYRKLDRSYTVTVR